MSGDQVVVMHLREGGEQYNQQKAVATGDKNKTEEEIKSKRGALFLAHM